MRAAAPQAATRRPRRGTAALARHMEMVHQVLDLDGPFGDRRGIVRLCRAQHGREQEGASDSKRRV
jgi:hypothetical protein